MVKLKDVVYILTYIIAILGFLSVVKFIPIYISLIFIFMFLLGVYFDRKNYYPIPNYLLNSLGIIFLITQLLQITLDNLVIPIINVLLILLGIKLLERKEFRDFMQIYTISIFLLSASALLTIDLVFLIYFTLLFFLSVLAIILLTFYVEDKNIIFDKKTFRNLIVRLLIIPLVSIPITAIFFTILPRTEYPLFNFLNNQGKGKTGFSDSVQLGDVSDIQMNKAVIMRVKTDKPIERENLYWRGLTLNTFNGQVWFKRYEKSGKVKVIGKDIKQEIILEPYGDRYLFSLDKPVKLYYKKGYLIKENDLSFSLPKPIFTRLKYRAISKISPYIIEDNINRKLYLQVPKNIDRRIVDLALSLKGKTEEETLNNIDKYFKNNFYYSLKKLPKGDNPLYHFLFKYKYGNCEYFASATAILLRINGIPSRIVVGYRGGFYNKVGKYYIVKQSDAHSWVEAYIKGRWVRVDTTPSRLAENSKDLLESLKENSKLDIFLDTLEYYWINFIINYDLSKQKAILNYLSNTLKGSTDFKLNLNLKLIVVPLVLGIVIFVIYRLVKDYILIPKEIKILNRFIKILSKKGYKKKSSEGLEEFVIKIKEPNLKEKALEFIKLYESVVFKDKSLDKDTERKLLNILEDLEKC